MIIGLYGGVGAGKTTIAKEFLKHGGELIVADEIVKEAHRKPSIQQLVRAQFGGVYFEGKLDTKKLADIVFEDEKALHELEMIVHPFVEREILKRIKQSTAKFVVLDVPLLASSPFHELVTIRVFIDTPLETRQEVCRNSRGWTDEEHARREAKQVPVEAKRKMCQYVVKNFGEHRAIIAEQVRNILAEMFTKNNLEFETL